MKQKRNQRLFSWLLVFSLIMGLVWAPVKSLADTPEPTAPTEETTESPADEALRNGEKELIVLHANDIHGHAQQDAKGGNIGYATFKNVVDAFKAEGKTVLVLDAGDATQGTNFATLSKGNSMIRLMNQMPLDGFVPGNHEFDYNRVTALNNRDNSTFPWYASNVFYEGGTELVFKAGEVIERDGIKIGLFGLATPETKYKADPRNTEGLRFADTVEENVQIAQAEIDRLRGEGAQVVIMLCHLGSDEESVVRSTAVAPMLHGLDLVIDGHSHTEWPEGSAQGDALLVSAGEYLKNIGVVTMTLTPDGVTKSARLMPYSEAVTYGENADMAQAIKAVEDEQAETQNVVIGKTAALLQGERGFVRTQETNLGDLITDAMRKSSGADVVLTNGGGIRASIDEGDVTVGEVFTVLPFGNAMTVIKVTGQDILDALNFAASDYPGAAGRFPHVSGMTYLIETPEKGAEGEAAKSRVTEVQINGEALEPEKVYTLATNDFVAVGGDGYTMFHGKEQVALYGSLADIVQTYIEHLSAESGDAFIYTADGRIRVLLHAEDAALKATAEISALSFSDSQLLSQVKLLVGKAEHPMEGYKTEAFDISFVNEAQEKLVPRLNVLVTLPLSELNPEKVTLFHIPASGAPEEVPIVSRDGSSITFEAKDFSVYAVAEAVPGESSSSSSSASESSQSSSSSTAPVESSEQPPSESSTPSSSSSAEQGKDVTVTVRPGNGTKTPKTGDSGVTVLIIVLGVAIVAFIGVLVVRNRGNRK